MHLAPPDDAAPAGRGAARRAPPAASRPRPRGGGEPSTLRLRVSGLGHHFEIDALPTATLGDLKEEIERTTGIPTPYQRLIAKRKKLDDDAMVLGPTVMSDTTIVSLGIAFESGTKILLLHSAQRERDKEGIEKLLALGKEIDRIDRGRRSRAMDNTLVQELIIQVCCKIDAVETNGSDALRRMRKRTVRKAEDVARESEENVRGVDP